MHIPSLKNLCLESLALAKYSNPETVIPFDLIPSEIINALFSRVVRFAKENVVYVKSLNGEINFKIVVPIGVTIQRIREMVRQHTGCRYPSEVGLTFAGRELEDSKTLCQYGLLPIRTIYITSQARSSALS